MRTNYGIIDGAPIYQYSIPDTHSDLKLYERAFPTNPITGIKFHAVADKDLAMIKTIAPLIIKEEEEENDIFIIDLDGKTIGNYFFEGLIVDNTIEFGDFISDLKDNKITLGFINFDKTKYPETIGLLIQQITDICGNSPKPIVHIFFPDIAIPTYVDTINRNMQEYFLRESETGSNGGEEK